MSNTTATRCFKQIAQSPPSLFQNGNIVVQLHHVGWLVTGIFALIATIASAWLIVKHLRWYTNKREQRYIVRILFLVPIYANISFASYLFWNRSTPLLLIRDCYESIVLTAFFYLLLMYLSREPEEQQRIFAKHGLSREADREARVRGQPVQKWIFPLGFVKWKPHDGLYFLQLMKYGILQYGVIRPLTTLVAVILDYVGLYCESSWSPRWGHIYISAAVSLSVTIAMYCLIQLYIPVSKLLEPRRPLLKLFSIKAVVFLTFWQSTLLSILSIFGVVKNTTYMTAEDINIGIGAVLETFEMTLFAFLHIKAFSYLPYKTSSSKGTPSLPTSRLRSLGHAMDFRETCREIWAGCVYIIDKARGKEPSNERQARRAGHYENAFYRPRPPQRTAITREKATSSQSQPQRTRRKTVPPVHVEIEREINIEGERQWLGTGGDYIYGLEFMRRERSDGLEAEFERELAKRGYASTRAAPPEQLTEPEPTRRESNASWWRNIYKRLSQTDPDVEDQPPPPPPRKRRTLTRSRRHPKMVEQNVPLLNGYAANLDDLPPQSILGVRQQQQQQRREERSQHTPRGTEADGDVLMPLPVFQDTRYAGNPGRAVHRQSLPTTAIDRQASLSPPARRPLSGVEVNSSYLAPMSSRSSRFSRADSVLGRLFPDTMTEGDSMSVTDFGTTNDGTHSVFSMSTEGVGHARKTPRARLSTTTPQIMTRGQLSGGSGSGSETARQPYHVPEEVQPPQGLPNPSAAELVSHSPTSPLDSDRRKHISYNRPLPTPPSSDPSSEPTFPGSFPQVSPPVDSSNPGLGMVQQQISHDGTDIPQPRRNSQDLRRSNAQMRPRAMTGPPEQSASVYPFPSNTHQNRADHPPSSYTPLGHPFNSPPPIATTRSRNTGSPNDVGYQMYSNDMGSFSSSLGLGNQPSPSGHGSQSRGRLSYHPSSPPHSPHASQPLQAPHTLYHPYSSKPYSANNRLRKQDSRHGRNPASSYETPISPSRSPQGSRKSSRSPINDIPNGAGSRNWRTVDYTSTSWYLPAPHDS